MTLGNKKGICRDDPEHNSVYSTLQLAMNTRDGPILLYYYYYYMKHSYRGYTVTNLTLLPVELSHYFSIHFRIDSFIRVH